MRFDDIIDARHSVRKFHHKKPDWRKIIEAIDCARKGPLAGNIPAIKFILVEDPETIAFLAEQCQENFVADVHYVVIVVSQTGNVVRSYGDFGERYAHQQTGAAIENFWLKLTDLGLSTCWVGSFDEPVIKKKLKISSDNDVTAIMPIGYELHDDKQKRKPSLDTVLRFNDFKEKSMKPRKKVDAY